MEIFLLFFFLFLFCTFKKNYFSQLSQKKSDLFFLLFTFARGGRKENACYILFLVTCNLIYSLFFFSNYTNFFSPHNIIKLYTNIEQDNFFLMNLNYTRGIFVEFFRARENFVGFFFLFSSNLFKFNSILAWAALFPSFREFRRDEGQLI